MTDRQPVVELHDVSFSYNGTPALVGVNLTIAEREFVSVVGPNGGGKTTLLKVILGVLRPQSGTVRVFGGPPEKARARIGYVPQHADCDRQFPARVMDVVLMGRLGRARWWGPHRRADKRAALQALEEVGLAEMARRPFAELSGGQQQRVLVARALAGEPDLLLLDEPTANVDIAAEEELYKLLRQLNRRLTIILATHDVGLVSSHVHSVVCVKQRAVVHPTSELTGEVLAEIFGADHRLVRHDHRCAQEGHEWPVC